MLQRHDGDGELCCNSEVYTCIYHAFNLKGVVCRSAANGLHLAALLWITCTDLWSNSADNSQAGGSIWGVEVLHHLIYIDKELLHPYTRPTWHRIGVQRSGIRSALRYWPPPPPCSPGRCGACSSIWQAELLSVASHPPAASPNARLNRLSSRFLPPCKPKLPVRRWSRELEQK